MGKVHSFFRGHMRPATALAVIAAGIALALAAATLGEALLNYAQAV